MAHDAALLGRLAAILGDVIGVPARDLHPGSRPDDLPQWDSHANLDFIVAVEEEFGVTISTNDVIRIRSLGDMAQFLAEKTGAA